MFRVAGILAVVSVSNEELQLLVLFSVPGLHHQATGEGSERETISSVEAITE